MGYERDICKMRWIGKIQEGACNIFFGRHFVT